MWRIFPRQPAHQKQRQLVLRFRYGIGGQVADGGLDVHGGRRAYELHLHMFTDLPQPRPEVQWRGPTAPLMEMAV